jgi:hypothetical protein
MFESVGADGVFFGSAFKVTCAVCSQQLLRDEEWMDTRRAAVGGVAEML